jgi:hypothetical protein
MCLYTEDCFAEWFNVDGFESLLTTQGKLASDRYTTNLTKIEVSGRQNLVV